MAGGVQHPLDLGNRVFPVVTFERQVGVYCDAIGVNTVSPPSNASRL